MSAQTPTTAPPDLSIRSAPAPTRRFSKKALAIVLGAASALVLGSFILALSPKDTERDEAARELYSTTNKPRADGLAALPASYADIEAEPPILGPPLPGDLGALILAAHREGRVHLEYPLASAEIYVDEDATEAAAQLAEQTTAARQSELFFSNAANRSVSTGQPAATPVSAGRDPFEMLDRLQIASGDVGIGFERSDQDRKQDFLSENPDTTIYNPYRVEFPRSPWQVMAGTVIPATLLTGINSDLPGQIIGQVTEPVYDTVTGSTVLIPQGSRIVGRYDSVVAYGQSRALIVWNRIIMPDGSSIRIENLPGVDARGNAGLQDRVDNHTLRIFSAAALSSLISIGSELSTDDDEDIARALREAAQDGASRVGDEVVRRQLAVQPTITVRPGWRLRIIVHQDIILQPYGGR